MSELAEELPTEETTPLEVLRARARRLAQPLITGLQLGAGLEVLSFTLGRERYAIETRYLFGTRRPSPLTPLPMVGPQVAGLTNVHGELLVVFDLRVLLGVERRAQQDTTHFLLLGQEEMELAVEVDGLDSVETLDPLTLLDPTAPLGSGARTHLRGMTRDALLVLDGAALLADERLYVDAP